MKKGLSLALVTILILGLSGCGNSTKKQAVEQGDLAFESRDYDGALASYEVALNEDIKDEEVREKYDIIKKYQRAEEYLENENIESAEKVLKEIGSKANKYPIGEDIDDLKDEIKDLKKTTAEEEKRDQEKIEQEKADREKAELEKEDQLKQDQKAQTASTQQAKSTNISRRGEYLQKIQYTENSVNDIYNNSYEPDATVQAYQVWDNLLNEIWGVLKQQLPKGEMDSLRKVQRQWIKDKEATEKSIYDNGGSTSSAVGNSAAITEQRCRELVNIYMN